MIGKSIKNLLESSTDIMSLVQDVFPVACQNQSVKRFILYALTSLNPEDDNQGFNDSGTYGYRLTIIHDDHNSIEEVHGFIDTTLNGFVGVNEGNDIREVRLVDARDGWHEETERYMRYMDFQISLNA